MVSPASTRVGGYGFKTGLTVVVDTVVVDTPAAATGTELPVVGADSARAHERHVAPRMTAMKSDRFNDMG